MREQADLREDPIREPTPFRTNQPENQATNDHTLTTSDMAGRTPRSGDVTDTREVADRERQTIENRSTQDSTAPTPLFEPTEAGDFRSRWATVQATFVDDPRHAVQDADHLVAEAIQRLAQVFADERTDMERQWDQSGDMSTEDLRISLQKYRSFFERVLAA